MPVLIVARFENNLKQAECFTDHCFEACSSVTVWRTGGAGENKNRKARLRPEVSSPLMAELESALLWWAGFSDSSSALEVRMGRSGPLFQWESWGGRRLNVVIKSCLLSGVQHVTEYMLLLLKEIVKNISPVMFAIFKQPAILLMFEKGTVIVIIKKIDYWLLFNWYSFSKLWL